MTSVRSCLSPLGASWVLPRTNGWRNKARSSPWPSDFNGNTSCWSSITNWSSNAWMRLWRARIFVLSPISLSTPTSNAFLLYSVLKIHFSFFAVYRSNDLTKASDQIREEIRAVHVRNVILVSRSEHISQLLRANEVKPLHWIVSRPESTMDLDANLGKQMKMQKFRF